MGTACAPDRESLDERATRSPPEGRVRGTKITPPLFVAECTRRALRGFREGMPTLRHARRATRGCACRRPSLMSLLGGFAACASPWEGLV